MARAGFGWREKSGPITREIKIRCGANKKCRQFEQRQQCFSARIKNKNTKTKQWAWLVRTGGVKYYGGRLFFNISLSRSLARVNNKIFCRFVNARVIIFTCGFSFLFCARGQAHMSVSKHVLAVRDDENAHTCHCCTRAQINNNKPALAPLCSPEGRGGGCKCAILPRSLVTAAPRAPQWKATPQRCSITPNHPQPFVAESSPRSDFFAPDEKFNPRTHNN